MDRLEANDENLRGLGLGGLHGEKAMWGARPVAQERATASGRTKTGDRSDDGSPRPRPPLS